MPAPSLEPYASRRQAVLDHMNPGDVALIPSAKETLRNGDVEHPWRQASDFYYLTGLDEPDAAALLVKDEEATEYVLFVRPRDPARELWTGRRTGVEGAVDTYGAARAEPIDALAKALPDLLAERRVLHYALGAHGATDALIIPLLDAFRRGRHRYRRGPGEIHDPAPLLHEMRLHKDAHEIAMLREAAAISASGHRAAMRATAPGRTEREVQGVMEGTFRTLGSPRNGYGSIVAGGRNATILHYHENDQVLEEGSLLLIDAGAEVGYYTADITRTFPVSGRFTSAQRQLYQVVLDAELAAIARCRAGTSFDAVHDAAVEVLTKGMVDLGLLEGSVEALIAEEAYKPYYMHRTSHWLGMDVHDVGRYRPGGGDSRPLAAGMVLTVEPGIYVAEDAEGVPPGLRGVGVRIEDDVLITDGDPEVLTDGVPKAVEEIESLMAEPAPPLPTR